MNVTAIYINYLLVKMELEVERNKSTESLAYQLLEQDKDTINVISTLLTVCLLVFFGGSICKTAVKKARDLWQDHRGGQSLRTSTQDEEVGELEDDNQHEHEQDRAEENEIKGDSIEMTRI